MTLKQLLNHCDEFLRYKAKQKALGIDVRGLTMQLVGTTDKQWLTATQYIALAEELTKQQVNS